MTTPTEIRDSISLMSELLHHVSQHLVQPSKADRRAAALKLERIVAIASTLAATIHSAH